MRRIFSGGDIRRSDDGSLFGVFLPEIEKFVESFELVVEMQNDCLM